MTDNQMEKATKFQERFNECLKYSDIKIYGLFANINLKFINFALTYV